MMKPIIFSISSLAFLVLVASSSNAQVQRTFVSGFGSDSNPCSRTGPCRTFAQAISQTNVGGEVVVLDSAGYGAFAIAKPISIISPPGVYAGISVFSGNGITINVAQFDVVILRGLTINSQTSSAANGVVFNSSGTGGTLDVEACVVRGFNGGGIDFFSPGQLVVKDTVIRDCAEAILAEPTVGTARATIDHVTVGSCASGIAIAAISTGTSLAAIRDSSISGCNFGIGTNALSAGATAFLDVERCLVANGATALETDQTSGGASAMSISNCVISHNSSAGFVASSGTAIFSRGNNTIIGNGANQGSLTPFSAQ